VRDSAGRSHKLVLRDTLLSPSKRAPEPTAPPPLGPWLLVLGLIVAGIIAGLGALVTAARRPGRAATIGAAIALGVWTLVAGILGVLLTLLWAITDHRYAHSNENLLLFNPLWLILCVLVIVSIASGRAWRWTRDLAVLLATFAVVALLGHLVGVARQENLPVIALALPPALALVWVGIRGAAREARRRGASA
jgi:cytochrome bd-type quinol oxidase subunit 2